MANCTPVHVCLCLYEREERREGSREGDGKNEREGKGQKEGGSSGERARERERGRERERESCSLSLGVGNLLEGKELHAYQFLRGLGEISEKCLKYIAFAYMSTEKLRKSPNSKRGKNNKSPMLLLDQHKTVDKSKKRCPLC